MPIDSPAPSPALTLDGFQGPLDALLTLARAQTIALDKISVTALVDQLIAALRQAPTSVSLGQKADWVVMTAWLVQLRSRLLLPPDPGPPDEAGEAAQLRAGLQALDHAQALAGWLERRPQVGHDVFARGWPEFIGVSIEPGARLDRVGFLWAALALFEDDLAPPETVTVYRPATRDLHAVADARARILQRLGTAPEGLPLDRLLPDPEPPSEVAPRAAIRRRSAWSSTFNAALELARQGAVTVEQAGAFEAVQVNPNGGA